MSTDTVLIEITSRQVELMLKYTCPFESEEEQLEKLNKKRGDFHILKSNDFYAPRLIGDIVHYAKEIDDEYLLEELDELAEIIETAISAVSRTKSKD